MSFAVLKYLCILSLSFGKVKDKMILFTALDTSGLGRVNFADLSQQMLLELFVQDFENTSAFRDAQGNFWIFVNGQIWNYTARKSTGFRSRAKACGTDLRRLHICRQQWKTSTSGSMKYTAKLTSQHCQRSSGDFQYRVSVFLGQ